MTCLREKSRVADAALTDAADELRAHVAACLCCQEVVGEKQGADVPHAIFGAGVCARGYALASVHRLRVVDMLDALIEEGEHGLVRGPR